MEVLITRRDALRELSRHALAARVANGSWQRVFPRIYLKSAEAPTERLLRRAALLYAAPDGYLSCKSALAEWGLPTSSSRAKECDLRPPRDAVHLAVNRPKRLRQVGGMVVHHLSLAETDVLARDGVRVVRRELAVVQAFACLPRSLRRGVVLECIQKRFVLVQRVRHYVGDNTPGRGELLELLDVAEGGSHNDFEIRALQRVIRRGGLPEPCRQFRLQLSRRVVYIDLAYPDLRIAIELDGREWHFNAEARAADIRRDAELAALGWLTLRFTYDQITNEPEWVIARISETIATRLRSA